MDFSFAPFFTIEEGLCDRFRSSSQSRVYVDYYFHVALRGIVAASGVGGLFRILGRTLSSLECVFGIWDR
jgi:hypothetical protein